MGHREVAEAVGEIVPCVHMEWPDDSAPDLPWATYHGGERPVGADDGQVAHRCHWTVELYEKRRDSEIEKRVGDALRERFGTVRREESWVENDNMLMVAFTFTEIEGD